MFSPRSEPTPRDLRIFAVLQALFCGLCVMKFFPGLPRPAIGLLAVLSGGGAGAGLVWPERIRFVYRGWMRAVYPIGWCVSHLVLAITFYLVVAPIGLVMRLAGYDPLRRHSKSEATFWEERPASPPQDHYLRQF